MHNLSLLLASVSGQTQSAIPVTPPASPAPQGAASAATTVIPDISLSWGGYFQALAILCFALAALWLILWLVRRAGSATIDAPASMRIESRLALGPKNWLYVVRCQNKRLILGVSEKNISLVSESPLTEEEMRAPAKKNLFPIKGATSFLAGLSQKRGKGAAQTERKAEDDFPLLAREEKAQSAFDEFLHEETIKPGK